MVLPALFHNSFRECFKVWTKNSNPSVVLNPQISQINGFGSTNSSPNIRINIYHSHIIIPLNNASALKSGVIRIVFLAPLKELRFKKRRNVKMENISINRKYTVKQMIVDKNNVNKFKLLSNRRDIKKSVVNSMVKSLEKGKSFDAPFVLIENGSGDEVLDGNHRREAIMEWLKKHPTGSVEIIAFTYKDVSPEDKKLLYSYWNMGHKQTTNDFVKQYEADIELIKKLSYVSVYGEPNKIPFYRLIGAYLTSQTSKFAGGWIGSPTQFIEIAKRMGDSEKMTLDSFMDVFTSSFGSLDSEHKIDGIPKTNPYKKSTPLTALMKIWMDNRYRIKEKDLIEAFRKLMFYKAPENKPSISELISLSGMSSCKYVRSELVNILNTFDQGRFI